MGRKKAHPIRAGGILERDSATTSGNQEQDLTVHKHSRSFKQVKNGQSTQCSKTYFIEVDRSCWSSNEHLDIAEVFVKDLRPADECTGHKMAVDSNLFSNLSLRFRLPEVDDSSFRLGHFPLLPSENIFLELCNLEHHNLNDEITNTAIFSGNFDGPDESVSGLVHLVSQKLVTLRPLFEGGDLASLKTFRVRVEILRKMTESSESLLDIPRYPWRKSMMNVMSWLRPEITSSEAKYRQCQADASKEDKNPNFSTELGSRIQSGFDVAHFYEAIKPSKDTLMLENDLPDLLLQLRPYQRRAAYWMVQRETMTPDNMRMQNLFSPLCVPVDLIEGGPKIFYNPFCGTVLLHSESPSLHVSGGILADEMGLGKTVELLACILSNPMSSSEEASMSENAKGEIKCEIKRVKRERVECVCGAVTESYKYKGLWVQCDICDAWQHADCVGYLPRKKSKPSVSSQGEVSRGNSFMTHVKRSGNTKDNPSIRETDDQYICSLCSKLIVATGSIVTSSATLIVCPAPILAQWNSEITSHTRPGSLKTYIYEGAKNISPSSLKVDMTKLSSADIVLTTYDVLRDDLSHDSDRHNRDRRCMRFKKRYPVAPTLLTRIYWWRICLDEAQMVESNTASVTEMALRLRARHHWCITGTPIQRRFDDIYGLLRFLNARPFDNYRWWTEVIKDPYEGRDMVAMEFTHKFFKQILWRSSKAQVSEELGLPVQEECITWLIFSPIEEHFYRKQHETCMGNAHEAIERLRDIHLKTNHTTGIVSSYDAFLSPNEAAKFLSPLLKLRQACCHPQVGSSGLRSLQHSPMTMDEILEVLISKTKIEGEEALRRIVVALNGLAAIAIIEQECERAISLYKEALTLAEDNSDNFRLDPLLSLHIHHNLSDLLPVASDSVQIPVIKEASESYGMEITDESNRHLTSKNEQQNLTTCNSSSILIDCCRLDKHPLHGADLDVPTMSALNKNMECDDYRKASIMPSSHGCLRKKCDSIKQKYLSGFLSKLTLAQQDFRNSYRQVHDLSDEFSTTHNKVWWMNALNQIEQNKDPTEALIRKIDQALTRSGTGSSRVLSRFRSITGLKYNMQLSLESLESSRKALVESLLEIDQTMDNPKTDDVERVRYCPICETGDGQLCLHCELDKLFQLYEARLFCFKKGDSMVSSAEEAIDLQKNKDKLNLFFRSNNVHVDSNYLDDQNKEQRHASTNVMVSRSPSDLEVILSILKGFSKSWLGRDGAASATKQLLLFEAMRKEFVHARSLSRAQAQIFRAFDEINMSTSRLRLRESESEPIASNLLTEEELIPSGMQFSNDKFLALSLLACIKGQLRYLKGLVLSKQKKDVDVQPGKHEMRDLDNSDASSMDQNTHLESCPICHEKLGHQKMVFQCGHLTCCRCYLELTERAAFTSGQCDLKWVMCPTCRQRTDLRNIGYVDDKQDKISEEIISNSFQGQDESESSVNIQGSYGTKVEAITRRILRIKSIDPEAKFLVFSSWNDVLDVLEHSFSANGITYVRMKGGRKSQVAIAQFKGQTSSSPKSKSGVDCKPKPVQVLLLLMQHGANGLNLLEAQHVILVEPLLNPAAEAQAINRVHRIGQDKKTFVHRFLVKNTVEESIYKLNRTRNANAVTSMTSKHQDQPHLTLGDMESLFCPIAQHKSVESTTPGGSLMHLPPSVAAGLAAERRLMGSS